MPNTMIKNFADKSGKSVEEVEKLWDKAKDIATKNSHPEEYDYIVGILKQMLGLNESATIKLDLLSKITAKLSQAEITELRRIFKLLGTDINEETTAGDIGSGTGGEPEVPLFKGPQKRKMTKKKLRSFKQIAIDQQTDTEWF